MKFKKSDYKLIAIAVLLVIISLLIFNIKPNKKTNETKEETKIVLLKDYSRFFTINSCIYKYIVELQSGNIDNLLKLLDEEYIDNNNINQNNIFNNIERLNGNYTFESKKIYNEKINNNVTKYYVYGSLIEDTINGYSGNKVDKYYIVKMDTKNKTFSISPYNGDIFKEVNNG